MSDDSLFREVDEEVRREQLEKLWRRYGNVVVAVSIGVIVAVGGVKGWQYWQRTQAEKAGSAYFEASNALGSGKVAEANAKFAKLAAGGHAGFATLARFHSAGALAEAGKNDEAVKAFDSLAGDDGLDQPLRNLARVRAAWLLVDTASAKQLRSRLAGLDVTGSPWRISALEIIALAAYREGDHLTADKLFNQILADGNAPAGARQRATVMTALLQPILAAKASR